MTKDKFADHMKGIIESLYAVRIEGQKEYAHNDTNAFANFERVAERLSISREQILMVYFEKHIDGIHSHLKGHTSQREDVRGRIKDAIMYLMLLDGMIFESRELNTPLPSQGSLKSGREY